MTRALRFAPIVALIALSAAAAAHPAADGEPTFLLESIAVEGAEELADVLLGQTLLASGSTVSEADIWQAAYRLRRLPFVYDARPRLEKGSARGRHVLVFEVERTSRFVLSREVIVGRRERADRQLRDDTLTEGTLTLGLRAFPGTRTMLFAAAEATDANVGVAVGATRYGLFGGRSYATLTVRHGVFFDSLDLLAGEPEGLPGFPESAGVAGSDDATGLGLSLVTPLAGNHQLVVELEANQAEARFHAFDQQTDVQRLTARWIWDETDDPLFPSRGRRLSAGVTAAARTVDSHDTFADVELVTVVDEEAWAVFGELDRHFELSSRDTLSIFTRGRLVALSSRRGELSFDDTVSDGRLELRWSRHLLDPRRRSEAGALRAELGGSWELVEYPSDPAGLAIAGGRRRARVQTSLAYRAHWGLVRLGIAYEREAFTR